MVFILSWHHTDGINNFTYGETERDAEFPLNPCWRSNADGMWAQIFELKYLDMCLIKRQTALGAGTPFKRRKNSCQNN